MKLFWRTLFKVVDKDSIAELRWLEIDKTVFIGPAGSNCPGLRERDTNMEMSDDFRYIDMVGAGNNHSDIVFEILAVNRSDGSASYVAFHDEFIG